MAKTKNEDYIPSESESATPDSSKQLTTLLKTKEMKKDILNFEETVNWKISSGSLILDVEIGGGFTPGVQRLVGQNNQGKTPESLEILNNFLDYAEDTLGLYIKAEGRLSEENMARSKRKFTTDPSKWNNSTIFILESNIYEAIVDVLRDLVKNNPNKIKYGFIIDSTDGLILRGDVEKAASDSLKVAGPALISKKFLQNLNGALTKFGHMGILIGHATAEVKIDPYAKTLNRGGMYSGGSALQHFPNYILEFQPRQKADIIEEEKDINGKKVKITVGHWCRVVLRKSSQENKDKVVLYPIKYGQREGNSIWRELEIGDMMLELQMVKAAGAWVNIDQSILKEIREIDKEFPDKVNGINALYDVLKDRPEATKFLYKKVCEMKIKFQEMLSEK